jgi:hypothetical protein
MAAKARVMIWLAVILWLLAPNVATAQTQRQPNSAKSGKACQPQEVLRRFGHRGE